MAVLRMVEAAGIEPASANPPPLALHAYSVYCFNAMQPGRQGKQDAILVKSLMYRRQTHFYTILYESTPGSGAYRHTSGQTAPYWVLSSECVVVVVGN